MVSRLAAWRWSSPARALGKYQRARVGQSLCGESGRSGPSDPEWHGASAAFLSIAIFLSETFRPFFLTGLSLYYTRFSKSAKRGRIAAQSPEAQARRTETQRRNASAQLTWEK